MRVRSGVVEVRLLGEVEKEGQVWRGSLGNGGPPLSTTSLALVSTILCAPVTAACNAYI